MRVRVLSQSLPKRGNRSEEYEDALRPARLDREVSVMRCAVADGATETSFSGEWADLLVRAYCRGRLGQRNLDTGLAAVRERWRSTVGARPLPWYAEEKLRSGAFSSLIGLTISAASRHGWRWRAMAIGDSCLFHIRDETLELAFPLASPAEFTSRPRLLSTNQAANVGLEGATLRQRGEARPGDRFLLAADALACWALTRHEAGEPVWCLLSRAAAMPPDDFAAWMDELRSAGTLRNDDVTLLHLQLI